VEHRINITLADLGRDETNAERILDNLQARVPELGPVVSIDTAAGTLTVTVATDAATAHDAIESIRPALEHSAEQLGLPLMSNVIELHAIAVPAEARELEPAALTA
jgi:hypothetical protein